MGSLPCYGVRPVPYVTGGQVINVNIRADDQEYHKTIRIHEVNTLRRAIQTYQEQINKENLKIKKAIYEPDQKILPLDTCLNELNVDFANTIIVYL